LAIAVKVFITTIRTFLYNEENASLAPTVSV